MKILVSLLLLISTHVFAGQDKDELHAKTSATEHGAAQFQPLGNINRSSSASAYPETLANDPRKVRSSSSPKWLAAIGRLVTTNSPTKKEGCSLSLVADQPGKDGVIAITAGHCVDHWLTADRTYHVKDNRVNFVSNSGKNIERRIKKVFTAHMNPADYAIVRLNTPVPFDVIQPLINAPFDYADLLDDDLFGEKLKPFATMAGFSADKGTGKKGKVLTYHEKCSLRGGMPGRKNGYCYSYEGASGGAVVVTVDLGEFAEDYGLKGTQHLFVGSIVGSRTSDGYSKTMFTDTSYYAQVLDKILAEH